VPSTRASGLNYGSLYNVVEGLEKRGFIRVTETVREGRRPERTVYEITETGSREFVDWLSALITTPVKEYLQFEAALSLLPALPPAEAAELLRERINELEHRLNFSKLTMENMREAGLPRLFGVENEYMEALMQAELDYVRSLIKEIEDGTLDASRCGGAGSSARNLQAGATPTGAGGVTETASPAVPPMSGARPRRLRKTNPGGDQCESFFPSW